MKYIHEADDAKYYAKARSAFIIAQTEQAKNYLKNDTELWKHDATATSGHADASDCILSELRNGNLKVDKVEVTEQTNGDVTEVKVEFDTANSKGKKVVIVTANDSMTWE